MGAKSCPGATNIGGTPTLKVRTCPQCGAEVEIFSSDTQRTCACGFVAYNDLRSCIQWCRSARECIGDELFAKLAGGRGKAAV